MPRIEPAFALYMKLVLDLRRRSSRCRRVVLLLARLGLITARLPAGGTSSTRCSIIFIIGAVLSPGTDPVGQIVMAGPMILLYFLSIAFAWLFGKKRQPAED